MKKNILLIYPKTGIDLGATVGPPHALLSIAAPLIQEYNVKILDQRIDPDFMVHLLFELSKDPLCVGITTMTGTQIMYALQIAQSIRRCNYKVPLVWGGAHPSSVPEQTVENEFVNVVCIGEGDITFKEIVEAIDQSTSFDKIRGIVYKDNRVVKRTEERELLDVEKLLDTPWSLVNVENYIHRDFYMRGTKRSLDIGQTSRGCPFQCGFCSSATLRRRKWRAMSVEKALNKIIEPVKRFNLDSIWIRDDEFYIDKNRAHKICEGILNSNLKIKWYTSGTRIDTFNSATDEQIKMFKRSGANTLKFGAESGSDKILDLMKKGIHKEDTIAANLKIKKYDIIPVYALMIGFPTETFNDIHQTIDLYNRLRKDNRKAQFEIIGTYLAFPATPLWDLAIKNGLKPPTKLEEWSDWLSDEYDLAGKKIPWFNKSDRKKIGNITYTSILANGMRNAIFSVRNRISRFLLKLVFIPISSFERFKLRNKLYIFAPELSVAKYLRKKIFYKKE